VFNDYCPKPKACRYGRGELGSRAKLVRQDLNSELCIYNTLFVKTRTKAKIASLINRFIFNRNLLFTIDRDEESQSKTTGLMG